MEKFILFNVAVKQPTCPHCGTSMTGSKGEDLTHTHHEPTLYAGGPIYYSCPECKNGWSRFSEAYNNTHALVEKLQKDEVKIERR